MPIKNKNGRIKVRSQLLNLRKFGWKLADWIKKFSKIIYINYEQKNKHLETHFGKLTQDNEKKLSNL
jgi:hypothetical protein